MGEARPQSVDGHRLEQWYVRKYFKDPADPAYIARLYDYVVRLDEPGGGASALLNGSSCYQAQRSLRRAIERWEHFWEAWLLWNKSDGSGPGWVTLPM
jgi:hypothetical protein